MSGRGRHPRCPNSLTIYLVCFVAIHLRYLPALAGAERNGNIEAKRLI